MTNLVPGGGILFDGAKVLFGHGRKYIQDRNDERISEFHNVLMSHTSSPEECEALLNGEFEESDYHAILGSCIQDIEDEKTEVYARLLRSLIIDPPHKNIKIIFIEASKNLSLSDLEYLKEIYIQSKYDLMTVGGTSHQIEILLKQTDTIRGISINRFVNLGFLNNEKANITELASDFIKRAYGEENLTPEATGRKSWTGIRISVLSFDIGNIDHSMFYETIERDLFSRQIKANVHNLDSRNRFRYGLCHGGIVLVGDEDISGPFLEGLQKFSEIKPLVRINITKGSEVREIEGVSFQGSYSLSHCSKSNVKEEVHSVLSEIFA
ncbi:hypothetical protein Tel_17120 (plasmid) [Candidatus Tenderia electrophaga]|uniref:Uncharacterized protein n=1 Tax=Candidatus Tenderia electrophaga TaxID=1748243 RepID=A0A0S2TII1_9GAMM|nr:hypothetical protein Tel_17120 [Candidatus Tenderia electrophaga]